MGNPGDALTYQPGAIPGLAPLGSKTRTLSPGSAPARARFAERTVSKSAALLCTSGRPVTSALHAIIASNCHRLIRPARDSTRRCDRFGALGGSGTNASTSAVARATPSVYRPHAAQGSQVGFSFGSTSQARVSPHSLQNRDGRYMHLVPRQIAVQPAQLVPCMPWGAEKPRSARASGSEAAGRPSTRAQD